MWKLSPRELLLLKGAAEPFAHFVDCLIRAEAAKGGLPQSEILTQLRVNIADGGVDTQVTRAIPQDRSGWFGQPTCWQFKAVEAADVNGKIYKKKKNSLQEEINKPHVKKLIVQGYAYRFCLLGDLSPPKLENWEEQLKAEARRIQSDAVDPRVVHGGHLLAWAERFPAVVASLRDLTQEVLHWEAWARNCRAVTEIYVPNPGWLGFRELISQHADLNRPAIGGETCLVIGGAAGVGKTRLVFETLGESAASPGLVIYARDEQEARKVASIIANAPDQTALIIADECSPKTRFDLDEYLRGHMDRIRVFCLDSTGTKPLSNVWLSADSIESTTHDILEQNFPSISEERRRQYAEVSRGFVRLAADMCQRDRDLAGGDLSGLLRSVEAYVRHRLGQHLGLISLLALFHKVGFTEEVQTEVEALCGVANRARAEFISAVRMIRESPGFVVQAGRYWYVTPEIVAHVLFREGWRCWVECDLRAFLQGLPGHLQQQFIERAGRFGGEEVRDQLATFFRGWFGQLTMRDLTDPRTTSLACAMIESSPEEYLAKLRDRLDSAEAGDLQEARGEWGGAAWSSRQSLIRLVGRLASFPDFFEECEACLFRLALFETEFGMGNDAREIWRDLFGVELSGTATPFSRRIGILRARTSSRGLGEAKVAFRGLARVFDGPSWSHIGPPVVAGRFRPQDWQPASAQERRECYRAALELCGDYLTSPDADRRSLAFDVLVDRMRFLLTEGLLDDVARVLMPSALREDEARRVMGAVDEFLGFQAPVVRDRAREQAVPYSQDVRNWVDLFRPADFDGKLRSVCARPPWDKRFAANPNTRGDETDELAAQVRSDPSRLLSHLDWLASREARSAERLGFALGRIDECFACCEMIFKQSIQWGSASLLRGYIRGLVFADRRSTEVLLRHMAQLELAHPQMAVEILIHGGDQFDALSRVIQLVESHAISPRLLASFAMGMGRRELRVEELGRLLPYFVDAAVAGDADMARAGIRFLSSCLRFEGRCESRNWLASDDVRLHAWRLVEAVLPDLEIQHSGEWSQLVERLALSDLGRATDLLGRALLSETSDVERHAKKRLAELAPEHPETVMEVFGKALLDPSHGWRLQVHVLRDLTACLPTRVVLAWVRKHGIDAARAIARHLPQPYLDDSGHPIVPEVLDVILREYDDDEVYDNFTSGLRWGENLWGDSPSRFRHDAENARRFLRHPNRRVRKWAKREIDDCDRIAESQELEYAERVLP